MSPDKFPSVSVVVPVYNDPDGLRATIRSLVEQTYPAARYEIVVVDNDSTDSTPDVARSVATAHSDLVSVESETDVQGSYAARNTGIEASDGEILAFVDADVVADADWLETAVASMDAHDAAYAGCRVDVVCSERTCAGLYDAQMGFPVERYVTENNFAPTCALLVARDVVRDVGPFDEQLVSGGDVEFGQRVADAGWTLHYVPDARVVHPARSSLRSLLGKHLRVGRGITQRWRRYPDRYDDSLSSYLWGVLPTHPLRFPETFDSEWDRISRSQQFGTYAVSCLVRLARTTGRALERAETGLSIP
ncbi:glycosyltransferase [Salinibaculum salinum]|uniref:glycosyltransferase n=1 Tax=Salinibaculum salinum TaxID=3131996 RepID=UPI0030EDFC49